MYMSSALLWIPWGILTVIHIWLHRSYAQIFAEYFDFLVVLPLFGAHFVDMFSLPVTKLECAAVGKKWTYTEIFVCWVIWFYGLGFVLLSNNEFVIKLGCYRNDNSTYSCTKFYQNKCLIANGSQFDKVHITPIKLNHRRLWSAKKWVIIICIWFDKKIEYILM